MSYLKFNIQGRMQINEINKLKILNGGIKQGGIYVAHLAAQSLQQVHRVVSLCLAKLKELITDYYCF